MPGAALPDGPTGRLGGAERGTAARGLSAPAGAGSGAAGHGAVRAAGPEPALLRPYGRPGPRTVEPVHATVTVRHTVRVGSRVRWHGRRPAAEEPGGADLVPRPHVLREYALLADGERGALVGPHGDPARRCATWRRTCWTGCRGVRQWYGCVGDGRLSGAERPVREGRAGRGVQFVVVDRRVQRLRLSRADCPCSRPRRCAGCGREHGSERRGQAAALSRSRALCWQP